jgi:rhodanese-related sulfurtransferase
MSSTITPKELKALKDSDKKPVLLDVRRRADFEADRQVIPGAVWKDPESVEQWSRSLPKDQEVVIYCVRGGSVSKSVSSHLLEKGLQARYIEGGLAAWKEQGEEVVSE